jgi:hypothetical protein
LEELKQAVHFYSGTDHRETYNINNNTNKNEMVANVSPNNLRTTTQHGSTSNNINYIQATKEALLLLIIRFFVKFLGTGSIKRLLDPILEKSHNATIPLETLEERLEESELDGQFTGDEEKPMKMGTLF